ncbi:hypothetical protein HBN50_05455 [Halobacteriovorax sp. GB3]|uniref:hypothetical protein n=1 Tax=Halobacteriovorax sp. GB3 TaxID=2719615 RepID=UPI002361844D|nr:hypothetical protein [Halobacteriovorax sp. GB3]MDD0852533.1 hypothetical protein [Halobacteriovorax sp. GB3]
MFNKENIQRILFVLLTTLTVFILSRSHYHIPSYGKYRHATSDSVLMLSIQSANEVKSSKGELHRYRDARLDQRYEVESKIFNVMTSFSKKTGIDKYKVSKVFASSIWVSTVLIISLIVLHFFGPTLFGFMSVVTLSQSAYFNWLRYETYVPKMFGFMFFPVSFYYFVKLNKSKTDHLLAFLCITIALYLYPVSVVYYLPLLYGTLILLYLIHNFKAPFKNLRELLSQTLFVIYSMVVFLCFKKPGGLNKVVEKNIAELVYRAHVFNEDVFYEILSYHAPYLVITVVIVLFWFLTRKKESKNYFLENRVVCFGILFYVASLIYSLVMHYFADRVGFIRLTWLWRSYYYSFFVIVFSWLVFLKRKDLEDRKQKMIVAIVIPILIILAMTKWRFTPATTQIKKSLSDYKGYFLDKVKVTEQDREYQKIKPVIEFVNKTPREFTYLMPRRNTYSWIDAIFEFETNRYAYFGSLERTFFVGESEETYEYAEKILILDELYALSPKNQVFIDKLKDFMNKDKISHAIISKQDINDLDLALYNELIEYEDENWVILKLN